MLKAAAEYDSIIKDTSLEPEEREDKCNALTIEGATFDALSLTMTHVAANANPAVCVQPLCDSGENIEV